MTIEKFDFTVSALGSPTIPSPLHDIRFEDEHAAIIYAQDPREIEFYLKKRDKLLQMEKAGPREKVFHDPAWSKAAVLTAGGLCPGLNSVIKGIVSTLRARYKVPVVYGIKYGYEGLIPSFGHEPVMLDDEMVDDIHEKGGTILGSSRGRQDEKVMVETLLRMNINMLFCIGGDGTLRCAHDIAMEVKRRGLAISVIAIPKTIDNDISFIDQTFGFETAVYATNEVIMAAHDEAKGAFNGIGLINVMGRDSGFIAAYSALANSHVNYCLIPEEPFELSGAPHSLWEQLKRRLNKRHHSVIVVAEGAGQHLLAGERQRDKSGNVLHKDIGEFLRTEINRLAKEDGMEVNIKYFNPSYLIRSRPAEGTDAVLCLMLAQNAVHAAMSGRTDMVVGRWNNNYTHVPIAMATSMRKTVDVDGGLWRSVRSVTWKTYD